MCIVCADMSGQFRRSDFIPDGLAVDQGLSGRHRAAGGDLQAFLDLDDRGGTAPNGKISLTPTEAGQQITRTNASWSSAGMGQPATVTYAYRASAPTAMPSDTAGFSTFTQIQIEATELMLLAWSDVAGITFQRQGAGTSGAGAYSNNATMLFGNYSSGQGGAAAFAYLAGNPNVTANSGDVWVNSSLAYNSTPAYLQYGYQVLLHEIGHAIGLSHPADYNAGEGVSITYEAHATYFEDSRQYTVMSYFDEDRTGGEFLGRYSSAPLLDDIAAAQRLYGANMSTRTGDTIYGFNSNADRIWFDATQGGGAQAVIFAIWDAGGVDTLDFSGYSQRGVIDLRQGHFSSVGGLTGNVSIAMGAVVERAIGGSGADTLIGNSADNRLTGNTGNDTIEGGAGSDTAVYSGPQANYTITPGTEVVDGVTYRILTVSGPEGTDTLRNVEFLAFSDGTIAAPTANAGVRVEGDATADTINGTSFADWIFGADGADTINGGDGADRINGGRGADTLNGGSGVDTVDYAGSNAGVTVNLANGTASGGGGADVLSNFENVRGTAFADTITGDGNANVIEGGGNIDTLNGGGGADILIAGDGALIGAEDIIKPASTANISIASAINVDGAFDLMDDAGVINATTTPHAVVRGTGGGFGQDYYAFTVTAGAACTFDIAGAGFDTTLRIFDSAGNQLAVNDDEATGITNSLLNHTFATAGTYYVAVGSYASGSGASVVSGPAPNNQPYVLNISVPGHAVVEIQGVGSTLNGGDGEDRLIGGSSDDTINGGAGSDTAVFAGNRSTWTITDLGGGSFEISNGSQTDTLTDVEFAEFADQTVTLIAAGGPTPGNDSLSGTAGDDVIDGLAGDDTINGLGGNDVITGNLGSDTLTGGSGSDRFVYTSAAESTNDAERDLITDFTSAQDVLDLSGAGAGRVTIERSGSNSFVYFGDAPGGVYEGMIRLNGVALQGYDLLVGNPDLTLIGDSGVNNLTGHVGDDIIEGGGGADIINGAAGADMLFGGSGADRFDISSVSHSTLTDWDVIGDFTTGSDRLNLGALVNAGYTNISLSRSGGSTFVYFGLAGGAPAGVVEAVGDLNGADLLLANQTLNLTFNGSTGADSMIGAAGADTINGASGDDVLMGGAGNDVLNGGADNDALEGGVGADFLRGQAGFDVAVYLQSNAAVTVDLAAGTASGGHADGDTFFQVEGVIGSAFNDSLTGDAGNNRLEGGDGDDLLVGADGDDSLIGGAGNDQLDGGLGADSLRGMDGVDQVTYAASTAAVTVNLTTGVGLGGYAEGDTYVEVEDVLGSAFDDVITGNNAANKLAGNNGNDILNGEGGNDVLNSGGGDDIVNGGAAHDTINGGNGADILNGDAGVDVLRGGADKDRLFGGDGADTLYGDDGNDRIDGGSGRDILIGGLGNDVLSGGAGDDLFIFSGASGRDRIKDFNAGASSGDVIQLDGSIFVDFADVLANTSNDGLGNCVISKGGVQITLTGVLKAQLTADDFEIAAPAPALVQDKALTVPGLFEDDPLVLPVSRLDNDDVELPPTLDDQMDPLILPVGLESKELSSDDAPVVCPPGVDDVAFYAEASGLGPSGLATARGLFRNDARDYDWVA